MKIFIKNALLRYFVYLLAVLPLFIFRDFTLDNELRYLSIADEALRNGSVFTFTNHGILYADKPPLYLWIVMLGKKLFGTHSMFFLGLFSFVPALVIINVMDQWVRNFLSPIERLEAELLLLTSSFYIGAAIVLRMDMLLCMFIILSLSTFFQMYHGGAKPRTTLLFPFFIFMAIFSKGPLGLIIPLGSIILFLFLKKDLKSIRKYWGWKTLAILFALCGIWFTGVYAEAGWDYLSNMLVNQTVGRAISATHHKEPVYFYAASIWYSTAPWSLLLIGILVMGIKKKLISTDLELFFLTSILSTLVILSLVSSKLAIYLLPCFPFLVYLSVMWMPKLGKWIRYLVIVPALLLCMVLPAVMLSHYLDLSSSRFLLMAGLILSLSGIITLNYVGNEQLNKGIITMGAGILLAFFTSSLAVPKYNSMIGLGQLCEEAKTISSQQGVANYYYCKITRADNLDVYLGVIPTQLMIHDLFEAEDRIKKPSILFLSEKSVERNDSLKLYIKGKKIHHYGKYFFVEIEPSDSILPSNE